MIRTKNHFMVHITEVPIKPASEADGWIGFGIRLPLPPEMAREGGVALFHALFPPGARHERHRHPNADEFFYVIRGKATLGTEDEVHEVSAGTFGFIPKGKVHWARNSNDGEFEAIGGYLKVGTLEEAGYEYVGKID